MGSCFKKDILNLVYICRQNGLNEVADYWESVVQINLYQHNRFVSTIVHEMFNTIAEKKIAISFGFSFKADTGDTRESPAIHICKRLHEEGAILRITDPKSLPSVSRDLKGLDRVEVFGDPYQAIEGAHAIALVTDWKEFKDLDYKCLFDSMTKPAFFFDGRNLLDHDRLYKIGFNVYPIGEPPLRHF